MNLSGSKRKDFISWEDYFMGIAFLSARRSKDPRCQVGACIVNDDNIIVSTGYNGMPNGCNDDDMPWGKSDEIMVDKHSYVCHAEMNAILNRNKNEVKNCRLYVTLFPCRNCSKLIVQSGIKEVIYLYFKQHKKIEMDASKWLFNKAGVKYREFKPSRSSILIDFGAPKTLATSLGKL